MDEPGVFRIPVAELGTDAAQPRHGEGDRKALDALKTSMHELGRTVQYVTVSPLPEGGYRIVSGHRRVQAARELDWDWLPVIVVDDVADDVDRRLRQIAENSARAALKPIELCEAIEQLKGQVDPPRIAAATGVSLRTVYNYLGILEHQDLVDALREGRALRTVLAEVTARKNTTASAAPGSSSGKVPPQGRAAARRSAKRSVARLRQVWETLDDTQRQELAQELRALFAKDPVPARSPASATLQDSHDLRGEEFGLAQSDDLR